MNKNKTVFFMMTVISSMITMCSNSWMGMWMGMEMNMLSFIPLVKKKKSKKSSEAVMMYFMVQSLSSSVLMFSIIINSMINNNSQMINTITFMSLMAKMGAAPFHMWLPEMMAKMEWNECMMMMTWQKLAPMSVSMNTAPKTEVVMMTAIMSILVGSMGGINQTSIRKIMGYSSINHLGWMIPLNKIQNNWMIYLMIYSMMIISTCSMFKEYNMKFITQVNSMNLSFTEKTSYIMSMMSLGGMPPLIGFLPKWMVIQSMMQSNMNMMMMIMIMMSMINLFFYMRTMSPMIMSQSTINKWVKTNHKPMIINTNIMVNMSLPMLTMLNII
uniref:NADH dehydrogenase subunit 2 n=1 Tax=Calacta lugubris TaxID=2880907 RepID=UPI001D11CC02|nr:NADH dehydrogenase subunit 2 [Calacta lugubris]UCC45922.1 NADH dehydrogenase subunit 2 [Calacta lugubris]